MKDIKTLIIGFLLATCMFLMMGQGSNDSQVGRYQAWGGMTNSRITDTMTGETFSWTIRGKKIPFWEQVIKPNDFRNRK